MKNEKINIPSWAQGVIAVASIAAIGLAVYAIHRKIKNAKSLQGAKSEIDATNSAVNDLNKSGQKPTLTNLQLTSIANQIFTAVNGYQSDEASIYRAFANVKNDLDVVNLIKAFGIREISTGAGNPSPNLKGTLSQVLTDELNSDEIKALNDMLARKGIKYRF